jgi:UDP-N-acetylglucosamine 2-epimerase (non-hydrolysing)
VSRDVAIVLGTRPEAIKLFVLVELLGERARVIHTGQHFDENLAAGVADDLHLRAPDVQLQLGGIPRGAQIGRATDALTGLFREDRPGAVVVQGDTNSSLAGALAANAEEIPIVHVEAGLRSHDRAMPEEHNRVLIDHLADVCAAPTDLAAKHLAEEGIPAERVVVTGNTVVEAVQRMVPEARRRVELRERYGMADTRYVVATLHRPENVDSEPALRAALEGLQTFDEPVLLPLHPRTAARVRDLGLSDLLTGLRVVPPLVPSDFLGLAAEAALLVSDSGGVQEEVSVLKRPVLVVRRSTERPEALGTFAELIGPEEIAERGHWHLHGAGRDRNLAGIPSPFGDGTASQHIADLAVALADG